MAIKPMLSRKDEERIRRVGIVEGKEEHSQLATISRLGKLVPQCFPTPTTCFMQCLFETEDSTKPEWITLGFTMLFGRIFCGL